MIEHANIRDRFFAKTRQAESPHPVLGTRCVLWTGAKVGGRSRGRGYGQFWLNRRIEPAHRVAWEFAHGEIPAGKCIMHKCDVRNCVNVEHLMLGTVAENNRDMHSKRRAPVGSLVSSAKLSDRKVLLARSLASEGMSIASCGRLFGVGKKTMCKAIMGKSWKHVAKAQLQLPRAMILAATMADIEQRA